MKKISTKLFIIAVICLIIYRIFIFLSISEIEFPATEQFKEEYNELKQDDPGRGWFLLIGGGMALFTDAALGIIYVTIFLIPNFILIAIAILQLVARLIQIGQQKNWKDTTSKVLTIISITLQILICIHILLIILFGIILGKILLSLILVLGLNITSVVLFIKGLKKLRELDVNADSNF